MVERQRETTHKIMSAIKQKDTEPELLLRRALWAKGMRYRKNVKALPGKPDLVFMRDKIAIFCDGDFWHGHNWALRGMRSLEEELSTYSPFWQEKIKRNVERDKEVNDELISKGWLVIRFWESDIRNDIAGCVDSVIRARSSRSERC